MFYDVEVVVLVWELLKRKHLHKSCKCKGLGELKTGYGEQGKTTTAYLILILWKIWIASSSKSNPIVFQLISKVKRACENEPLTFALLVSCWISTGNLTKLLFKVLTSKTNLMLSLTCRNVSPLSLWQYCRRPPNYISKVATIHATLCLYYVLLHSQFCWFILYFFQRS